MKFTKESKLLSTVLVILILFQSCTVYKSKGITLDKAAETHIRTSLITTFDAKIKCKYITKENGNFYCQNKNNGEIYSTSIDPSDITKVRIKDKGLTALLNIGVTAGFLIGFGSLWSTSSSATVLSFN